MKCPGCSRNHKFRDGMTCTCGYHFVFSPKTDGITDGQFTSIINHASRNDTYFFTDNQLYTEYCRKLFKPVNIGCLVLGAVFVVLIIGGIVTKITGLLYVGVIMTFGLLAYPGGKSVIKYKLSRAAFDSLLQKWLTVKKIPKLLQKTSLHQPPPKWPEPDIYDYGVERILVVQRDILVDLLVKNKFYAEQSCLIISVSKYPYYLYQEILKMIKENIKLSFFLLHDATREGIAAMEQFKQTNPFLVKHACILDVGLFPEDVRYIKALRFSKPAKLTALPVDMIPYTLLTMLLGESISKGLHFHALLLEKLESKGSSDGYSYG